MDWIVFFQNPYNRIIFISSQNPDERESLEYFKFLEFLNKEFKVVDFVHLKDQIDRFKIIHLIKDGTWESIKDLEEVASFQDLYKINDDTNKKEEKEPTPTEIKISKSKEWLDKIFTQRRKDNGTTTTSRG